MRMSVLEENSVQLKSISDIKVIKETDKSWYKKIWDLEVQDMSWVEKNYFAGRFFMGYSPIIRKRKDPGSGMRIWPPLTRAC